MSKTIICPNCHKEIALDEVLMHQIQADIKTKIEERIKNEMEVTLKNKEEEARELIQAKKQLTIQLLEINKANRNLRDKDDQRELQMQKILDKEKDNIRADTLKQFSQEHRLKDLEKEKKISDMEKLVEELKQKAQQGSMQTQGEVLELDLEEMLRNTFPQDSIEAVGKGITGADIRQRVRSPRGTECGVILWELKSTKAWKDAWIPKLKSDLRAEKANIPALVSQLLPKEAKDGIGLKDGVWVCSPALALPLALLLRKNLLDIGYQKAVAVHQGNKADLVYNYITSHEFSQQVEALVEVYREMNDQVAKERLAFEKSWKQRESQIKRLLVGTASIYGSMQGIAGAAMPQVKGMEILELNE